jgi:membrane protein
MASVGHRLPDTVRRTVDVYSRSAGGQHAAALSYHVFFSLVPFVALLLALLDAVLPETTADRVVSWLVGVLPLPSDLSAAVVDAVERSAPPASITGIVAAAGLLWAASGMMRSVRVAFRAVWASDDVQPYVRGKLRDFALVLGAGLLIIAAFGVSLVVQLVTDASTRIADDLGADGSVTDRLGSLGQLAGSLMFAFLAFLLLYRVVPPVATRIRDAIPAAALATVAVEMGTAGFSIYLERFADFDQVYGPLGAVFALLLLVRVTSMIILFGACLMASSRPTA